MRTKLLRLTASVLAVVAWPVDAHTGAGVVHDFHAGWWHPLLGVDHLLVMTGMGIWVGVNKGRIYPLLLPVFLVLMAVGAALHFQGAFMPGAELNVTVSVLMLGLIIASRQRLPSSWALFLAAIFGLLHGYVHAAEIGFDENAQRYMSGVMLSTAALLGLGYSTRFLSPCFVKAMEIVFGIICAGAGMVLLFGN